MAFRSTILFVLAVAIAAGPGPSGQEEPGRARVPQEYRRLAAGLESILDSFDADLVNRWDGQSGPLVFAAELLPANIHRGEDLLRPKAIEGVRLYLDRLKSLGVSGVKVMIGYPVLAPEFPRSEEYWAFFREVAREVRDRGMKLFVGGTNPVFPGFTRLPIDYSDLTWEKYVLERRAMARRIVQDLAPDYLTVSNEPGTQYQLTRLKELLDPRKYGEMIGRMLKGLERGKTRIGAGVGSWEDPEYVRTLARRGDIDYIDLHIYPVTGGYLQRASEMAGIARAAGKFVVVGEAWLYKASHKESSGAHAAATWDRIFARDAFSFWEPLDRKFIDTVTRFSRCHGVRLLSFSWSKYLFAYVDYDRSFRNKPPEVVQRLSDRAAVKNLLVGRTSGTGRHLREVASRKGGGMGFSFRNGRKRTGARSPRVRSIRIAWRGARPRFSPGGEEIVFDRKNRDGFYDVYIADLQGGKPRSLTESKPGGFRRHNGNAVFHPSGDYIVFVSEEEEHFGTEMIWLGDPGLGFFCNLYATNPGGTKFWKLTEIPVKKGVRDRTPMIAVVNPHFSPGGETLFWTERYAPDGRHGWGKWRIKAADFRVQDGEPKLCNERIVFRAEDAGGNYVTSMGAFPDGRRLLLAGNLDGQHEYGMDQYLFDLKTGKTTNLQNSPRHWEEDASISPDGRWIVYMSNATSRFKLDFDNPAWAAQPREREYWIMKADGSAKERLTYFNDPAAPEYLGRRVIVAASDFDPDGRLVAGTIGIDHGTKARAKIALWVVLIEMEDPDTPGYRK